MKRLLFLLSLLPLVCFATDYYISPGKVYQQVILTNPANGAPYTSFPTTTSSPYSVTIVDASGTITSGGTSQTIRAATADDKELEIYNNDSTEPICIKYGTTASLTLQGNTCIPALGYYTNRVSNQRIDAIATTTGHKFTVSIRQ